MSTWNLPPGVTTNDPHINPPDEPRHWRTGQHVSINTSEPRYGAPEYQTLLDAIYVNHLPLPVSHDDLTGTYVALALLGVRHNLVGSPSWWQGLYEAEMVRPPYREWCRHWGDQAVPQCVIDGTCQKGCSD